MSIKINITFNNGLTTTTTKTSMQNVHIESELFSHKDAAELCRYPPYTLHTGWLLWIEEVQELKQKTKRKRQRRRFFTQF